MRKTNLILDCYWEHEAAGSTQLTWEHTDMRRTTYGEHTAATGSTQLWKAYSSPGSTQLLRAYSYREHAPRLKAYSYSEPTAMGNTHTSLRNMQLQGAYSSPKEHMDLESMQL